MTLYFLDDVFRLNLAFKPSQCIFERLAFLHSNLCQGKYTSKSSQLGRLQNSAQLLQRNGFLSSFAVRERPKPFPGRQRQAKGFRAGFPAPPPQPGTRPGGVKWKRMIRPYQGVLPTVPASCYVDVSAQLIGDVVLGEHASIWMNAVVRGDVNSIRIGANSNVQDCAVLHGMRYVYPVIVGDWVTIGHNATVHGCVIEDVVLIGMGCTILNDCRIGEGSIIAAGAVLPEHTIIPPNSLVAGVPGKVRRTLGDADREMILKYARNYIDYTAIYLKETEGK